MRTARSQGHKFWHRARAHCCALLAFMALTASPPARAREQVRIGIGFGLAFLPVYICEDLKLVEKYARGQHLDVKVSFERYLGAGPMQDAIAAGAIDVAPFGTAPLLMAWEQAKSTPRQILAVSGVTTLPLVLLSNRADVHGIADLRPADRIAMPTLSAPQMYVLEMQSEKVFGQYDRLRSQVVALPPREALAALFAGKGPANAYFASPPFTQIALKDDRIHPVLRSEDAVGGKSSFLIMGARKSYIDSHAKIPQAIEEAMDEAARLIHDDPSRAARIYLAHEPSKVFDAAAIAAMLRENADEFGSAVEGIAAFAGFMARHGELKSPPQSWKDIVVPALLNSPST